MFSSAKKESVSTQQLNETFNQLRQINPEDFEENTTMLATSIINIDRTEAQQIIINALRIAFAKHDTRDSVIRSKFIKSPTPESFNSTSNKEVLDNAKKGTEHHTLYKDMLSLSQDQKDQLKERFGITLTKFVICNLIFLYTEGSKVDTDKGHRNIFALGRQMLNSPWLLGATDRDIKLEFFIRVLKELCDTSPFVKYQNSSENFVTDAREKSQYKRALDCKDDSSYMAIVKEGGYHFIKGVNTANALTLFDNRTLEIINIGTVTALENTTKPYADGAPALFSPPVEEKIIAVTETPEYK